MDTSEKNKKPKAKRLVINKEALRNLSQAELNEVVGGCATWVCTEYSCDTYGGACTHTGCCM